MYRSLKLHHLFSWWMFERLLGILLSITRLASTYVCKLKFDSRKCFRIIIMLCQTIFMMKLHYVFSLNRNHFWGIFLVPIVPSTSNMYLSSCWCRCWSLCHKNTLVIMPGCFSVDAASNSDLRLVHTYCSTLSFFAICQSQ
jgi:hypothetical protein